MSPHVQLLEDKICEIMSRTKKELPHGQNTKKWLIKIYPDAPWELRIAALAHDIERAVPDIPGMTPPIIHKMENEDYADYKKRHAIRSANIIRHLMTTYLFSQESIERVCAAISYHDNPDNNPDAIAVSDADSVRYFDTGLPKYIEAYGVESAKTKAEFMYKRVSKKAKKVIDALDFEKKVKKHLQIV